MSGIFSLIISRWSDTCELVFSFSSRVVRSSSSSTPKLLSFLGAVKLEGALVSIEDFFRELDGLSNDSRLFETFSIDDGLAIAFGGSKSKSSFEGAIMSSSSSSSMARALFAPIRSLWRSRKAVSGGTLGVKVPPKWPASADLISEKFATSATTGRRAKNCTWDTVSRSRGSAMAIRSRPISVRSGRTSSLAIRFWSIKERASLVGDSRSSFVAFRAPDRLLISSGKSLSCTIPKRITDFAKDCDARPHSRMIVLRSSSVMSPMLTNKSPRGETDILRPLLLKFTRKWETFAYNSTNCTFNEYEGTLTNERKAPQPK